ncbi:hypothetical protein [Cryptosporangium japonicum]
MHTRMNPGKVTTPNPLDGNVRLGADFCWTPAGAGGGFPVRADGLAS